MPQYGFTVRLPAQHEQTVAPVGNGGEVMRLITRFPNGVEFSAMCLTHVPKTQDEYIAAAKSEASPFIFDKELYVCGHRAIDTTGRKVGRFGYSRQIFVSDTIYWLLVEGMGLPDKSIQDQAKIFMASFILHENCQQSVTPDAVVAPKFNAEHQKRGVGDSGH